MPETPEERMNRLMGGGATAVAETPEARMSRLMGGPSTGTRATPEDAASVRASIFGSADPDSQPAPDEVVNAVLDLQGHGSRVEAEIAKYSKELDRGSFPGIFKPAPSEQAIAFERMGAEGYRKAERDLAIERMGGVPTLGRARQMLSAANYEARVADEQSKIRQSENPILRYGARLAVGAKEQLENAGAYVRENLIRPAAPGVARALDALSARAGMSEEGKAVVREDTKGLLGDAVEMVGQTAAFIPQVALGGVPGAAAVSTAASGGDVMAGVETAAFLKTAGALTKLFGGASESVVRQVLAEGGSMTAAGVAMRLGFHGDPGTLQQAGVDALSGLAFGVMGGGARAREAAARLKAGLEAGKTIDVAAAEAGIPPERLKAPETAPAERAAPPVEAPAVAPERAPEIAPQSDVVAPRPVEAPAPEKPVSVAPVAPVEAPKPPAPEPSPVEPAPAEAPRVAERPVEPPKDPTPPVPEAPAAPAPAPEGEGFSIKNAAVAERREARGAEPLEKSAPQTQEGWNAEAERQMAENPNRPYEVMADLKRTGRAHTPVEFAILLRHQKDLNVAYKKAYEDITESAKRGDPDSVKEAKVRAADILLKSTDAAEAASGSSGAEAGRSLAARQMALAEDYSVLALTRERTIANDGKPLSKEMEAKIADISTRMDNIQRELDAYRAAAAKAKAPRGKTVSVADVKSAEFGKRNTIVTREAFEATRAALREKLNRMSVNPLDPTILADLVKMGTFYVEGGIRSFAAWSKAMKEEFGEKVDPYLKGAWDDAQAKMGKPLADAKAALAEGAKAGKAATDNPAAIQKLAEYYVREGVTDRGELISKVHEALQESSPGITFRQTMDAISGYGVYKQLNNDPAKIRLRELKTEMQQLAKLEDMAEGKAPAKTGVERQEMTDEARRLAREVNEKKREGGYETTDPAKQLKTALESTKTRLRHEIADLSRQIATKTKDIPDKAKVALDPEAQALKKRRDELRAEYQETFGKPGMTDAQRLEAAVRSSERAVAALEKQIERGDVFPESKPAKVTDARLEALKARREELSKRREDLRAAALEGSKPSKVQQSIDRAVAALDKSIVEYKAKLATGNIAPKPKGDGGPTSPKIEALRAERDALRKQMDAARNAARPRLSPEQIARKTRMTRIQRTIDKLEQQIAAKDFSKKAKTVNIPNMAEARLLAKQEMVRQEWQAAKLKDEWQKKSVLQKAGSLAISGTRNLSRALMTAWDFSAPLRQGAILTASHPIKAAKAMGAMFRAFRSPEHQAMIEAEMRLDPKYGEAKRAGLFLSEHADAATAKMEENLVSGWIERIPGVGASQRAYMTFLNKLRFDVFKGGLENLSAAKEATPAEARAWANFINVATGRGGPQNAPKMDAAFNALNNAFFAPRLAYSRFQILLGTPMWRGTAASRKMIAMEYARSMTGLAIVYGLSQLVGGKIEKDGKVRFGNSVLDPTAGLASASKLLQQTMPGMARAVTGARRENQGFGRGDEVTAIGRYLRGKLAPLPGSALNLMSGKDPVGKPVTLGSEAVNLTTPMSYRDIYLAMKEHGVPKGAALGVLALFGMGLQNYRKKGG